MKCGGWISDFRASPQTPGKWPVVRSLNEVESLSTRFGVRTLDLKICKIWKSFTLHSPTFHAKSSYGWSPLQLPHKIENKKPWIRLSSGGLGVPPIGSDKLISVASQWWFTPCLLLDIASVHSQSRKPSNWCLLWDPLVFIKYTNVNVQDESTFKVLWRYLCNLRDM